VTEWINEEGGRDKMGIVVGESSEYQQRSNKQTVTKAGPFPGKSAHFVAIHFHDSAPYGPPDSGTSV
jgi:hypothetical protein